MKAFPVEYKNPENGGMDLRDYFAAKAMQAILFDIRAIQVSMDKTANLAYKFADAMMKARENDS
jgi:hypothetical protein